MIGKYEQLHPNASASASAPILSHDVVVPMSVVAVPVENDGGNSNSLPIRLAELEQAKLNGHLSEEEYMVMRTKVLSEFIDTSSSNPVKHVSFSGQPTNQKNHGEHRATIMFPIAGLTMSQYTLQ